MSALLNPIFEVRWKGTVVDPAVSRFSVHTTAAGHADTSVILFHDPEETLVSRFGTGDRMQIWWGYLDDTELIEIFDGVIRNVSPKGLQTNVELIGWLTILQAKKIVQTWENATPAEIISDMLADTGLELLAVDLGTEIDRFPVHNLSVKEALNQLVAWIKRDTGEEYRFYVRAGELVFALPNESQNSIYKFRTGANIIHRGPGKLGLLALHTFTVPVLHSQVITIDGEKHFVEEASYSWDIGGRTVLQVRPC